MRSDKRLTNRSAVASLASVVSHAKPLSTLLGKHVTRMALGRYVALFSLFLVLLLSYRAWAPLTLSGYLSMHDDFPSIWLFEMDTCFQDGQLPCRWLPDWNNLYGAPLFNYQPPLVFYVGEIIHLLGFSILGSVKILFILGFLLAAFFMFLLAREFWGNWGGVVSAVFYVYAPYLAVDVYVRGAVSEQWGIALSPAILWAIYRLVTKREPYHLLLLSLLVALLLLTHSLMTMMIFPVALAWAVILIWRTRAIKRVSLLALSGIWGVALAGFFTLPMLFEQEFVHLEPFTTGYFAFQGHFPTLNQLFISRFWGYGGSVGGPDDGMSFQVGWIHWGVALLSIAVVPKLWRENRVALAVLILTFVTFWLSILMMLPDSLFVWRAISPLKFIQFPWRFLGISIFASSFLAGSILYLVKGRKLLTFLLLSALIGGVIAANHEFFEVGQRFDISDAEKFSGGSWEAQTAAHLEYQPNSASNLPGNRAEPKVQIAQGNAIITDVVEGSDSLTFSVFSRNGPSIRVATPDFPNWKVRIDDEVTPHDREDETGLITFPVAPGSHRISLKLEDTAIRTFANGLSLAAWAVFLVTATGLVAYKIHKRAAHLGRTRT